MKNEFMTPENLKLVGKYDKIDKSDLNNLKFVQLCESDFSVNKL